MKPMTKQTIDTHAENYLFNALMLHTIRIFIVLLL